MTHPTGITSLLPHPDLATPLAKHDVAALNELSDASQVRAWTRRKVVRYKKYITALLAIHNSIAPINKLPTEILQQIFVHVPFESREFGASWLVSLQSVCRRWRSVLLATPEYWLRGLHVVLNPPARMAGVDSDEDGDQDSDEEMTTYDNPRDLFLARSVPCPLKLGGLQTSSEYGLGWELFEDHFDRVTHFDVQVEEEDELYDVLHSITTSMKRLEKLELSIEYESDLYPGEHLTLAQWRAENLPRLRELKITGPLFSRATTVPSLHKLTLYGSRDIMSLPGLLDALEGCPALAEIYVYIYTDPAEDRNENQTVGRIVNLPNLRLLEFGANIPDLHCFLSCLSFPSTTGIDMFVDGGAGDQFALPSVLPRRISGLYTSPTIDRLYIYSDDRSYRYRTDAPDLNPDVSMIGFVEGKMRLKVHDACRFHSAADCFRFLEAFAACTVTELALDFGPLPNDMDGAFWRQFFDALPDVRRLELLSRTTQSSGTKRNIAEHFLASTRGLQQTGYRCSLGWVLRAEAGSASHLEEQLGDVEQVLSDHLSQGGTLHRLELYITTSRPSLGWSDTNDVAHTVTDGMASRSVTRDYVSRLEAAADVVVVGGGWGFAEDDELSAEDRTKRENGQGGDKRKPEEKDADFDDMQIV